jgi:hypothetical protein
MFCKFLFNYRLFCCENARELQLSGTAEFEDGRVDVDEDILGIGQRVREDGAEDGLRVTLAGGGRFGECRGVMTR